MRIDGWVMDRSMDGCMDGVGVNSVSNHINLMCIINKEAYFIT